MNFFVKGGEPESSPSVFDDYIVADNFYLYAIFFTECIDYSFNSLIG